MIKAFQFSRLPIIYFGPGRFDEVPSIIKRYGSSIILVTGKSSFFNSSQGKKIMGRLRENGITYRHIVVSGEPSPGQIDDFVKDLKYIDWEVVIAVGGGSVIDTGKAISAMMHIDDSVINYLEGVGTKNHPGTKLPFLAVPTTSGTGSEATKNAVISYVAENGFKRSLRHDNFVPDIAIVDPELTLNCPADITASSGMDCFTQLTEAYLSDRCTGNRRA
jgi:alcohol dehydrogenase class IV